jgi:nucleotide-binding universal stress UspA family protein
MRTKIRAGRPTQEIVRSARDHGADRVVIGHSGLAGV